MAYEAVKKLKCITNVKYDHSGKVDLRIGEVYESACSNSSFNDESFLVWDENGELQRFNKRFFEITETEVRENSGWIIKCNDCKKELMFEELAKNDFKCPKCGQLLQINSGGISCSKNGAQINAKQMDFEGNF